MHCWLLFLRHTPGRTWVGYRYRCTECRVCGHRYPVVDLHPELAP